MGYWPIALPNELHHGGRLRLARARRLFHDQRTDQFQVKAQLTGHTLARLVHALHIGISSMQSQSTLCELKTQKLQAPFVCLPFQSLVQNLPGFVLLSNRLQMLNLLLPGPML